MWLRLAALSALMSLAAASNCGGYTCPAGFTTKGTPAAITCACCDGTCAACTPGGAQLCDTNNANNNQRCCNGNTCTGGASGGADPNANYASCQAATQNSGDTCVPTCATGYVLNPPAGFALVCVFPSLQFDASGATCDAIACAIANSNMVAGDCSCQPGFTGTPTVAAGAFTHTCTANPCTNGPDPATLDPNADSFAACTALATGATCTPTCRVGYQPAATVVLPMPLICSAGFLIDATAFVCEASTCTLAPAPLDPQVSDAYASCLNRKTGELCTPPCNVGYFLSSPFTMSCTAAGNWVAAVNCVAAACPTNAATAGTCACNAGFGAGVAPTFATPSWTHSCPPNTCGGGATVPIATADYTTCLVQKTGDTCDLVCQQGFIWDMISTRSFILSCDAANQFVDGSGPLVCNAAACPVNARQANTLDMGADTTCGDGTVATTHTTTACNVNFLLDGAAEVWDAANNRWTHECLASCQLFIPCVAGYTDIAAPTTVKCSGTTAPSCDIPTCCTPNVCVAPAAVPIGPNYAACNGLVTGNTCFPSCDAGYTVTVSSEILNCNAAGVFVSTAACVANTCTMGPSMALDPNADYASCNIQKTADTCTPVCNLGYTITGGTFALLCNAEQYDATGVTCVPTTCTGPTTPDPNADPATGYASCTGQQTGGMCTPVCRSGYRLVGTTTINLICSPTYDVSGASCDLQPCPVNAGTTAIPGQCVCLTGYTGTLTWTGTAWNGMCVPDACTPTQILNSVLYSTAGALNGNTGDAVMVDCNPGYIATFGTATCRPDGTWDQPTCTAQPCNPNTMIPNSVAHEATGVITGFTDDTFTVVCKTGFVCSATPCQTRCDGVTGSWTALTCNAVPCPTNAEVPGTCNCRAAFVPIPAVNYDTTLNVWTHECHASCGWYTCTNTFELRGAANSIKCAGRDIPSCSDTTCCVGVITTPSGVRLQTTEAGGSATYTVVLIGQPTVDVTIDVTSSDVTEGNVDPSQLIFSPTTWAVPQTVTVKGIDDDVADGDIDYAVNMAVSGDAEFLKFSPNDVLVTNADDDVRDIVVTLLPVGATALTIFEDASGAKAEFTVVLRSQPLAQVTMTVTSSDTTEGLLTVGAVGPTATPIPMVFTPTTWDVPQTVTISGVDEFIDDGDISFTIMTSAAVSTDANYNTHNPPDVSVRCIDNDQVGITVTAITSQTTEAGGTATFSVVLNSEPTSAVTIMLSSSDTTEGLIAPTVLSFSAATWNVPAVVTLTGVDDLIDDGNVAFTAVTSVITSLDPMYNNVNPDDAYFTNIDDDTAGIFVTPTALTVSETGNSGEFTVVLLSEPTSDVTVQGISRNPLEGSTSPSSLLFTSLTWSTPQTITVTGVDDFIDDDDVGFNVTIVLISGDLVYDGLSTTDVRVTNADNDTAGITVAPTSGLITSEEGGSDTFTIVLNSQPVADVSLDVSSLEITEGSVTPLNVRFTASNWDIVRTFTVSGVDEFVADGNQTFIIRTHPAVSTDAKYSGLDASNVTVLNVDNDVADILVEPSSGLTTTERNLGTTSFTVVLTSQPTGDVTIGITSQDTSEGILQVGLTQLVFTNITWNSKQLITVSGVDDTLQDGDIAYTIDLASAVSTDPNYNNQNPVDVSIINLDDDKPGIWLSPNHSIITKELGAPLGMGCMSSCGNEKIDITLTSIPAVGTVVRFCVNTDDTTEADIQVPATKILEFDSTNWNRRKIIEVNGTHDWIDDGDQPYNIIITDCGSTDPNYMSWPPAPGIFINATNIDEDTAGLDISPVTGIVTSEIGTTGEVLVKLLTKPVNPVYVKIRSDPTEGLLSDARNLVPSEILTLQFDTDNTNGRPWNTLQTVTVTGVDDYIDDDDQTYNLTIGPVTSIDAPYSGLFHPGVLIRNEDNDTAEVIVTVPTVVIDPAVKLGPAGELITSEAQETNYFDVVLATQPTDQVTVHVTSNDVTEGTTSPGSLVFFPNTWNITQRVTVTGASDDIQDGDIGYLVQVGPVMSVDQKYNGLDPNDVPCLNTNDDTAGIFISGSTGMSMMSATSELGDTAEFTVSLTSEPLANVLVTFESQNDKEGTVFPVSMTFTSLDWSTTQTLTITGVDDFIDDGDVLYTVDVRPAVSLDPVYSGMSKPSLQLTNTDNDVAGFVVTPKSGLSVTEDGTATTFTVVLSTQPKSSVHFVVGVDPSSDTDEVTLSPLSFAFNEMDWRTPKTVTITGMPDNIIEVVDPLVSIDVAINDPSTFDMEYKVLPKQQVNVTNIDIDKPGIKVLDTTLRTHESGSSATFRFALNSIPEKNVSVDLVIGDATEGALGTGQAATIVFVENAPITTEYTVTIVGVDDNIDDGDITYTIQTLPSISQDANYNSINPIDVVVVNEDDDTAGVSITTPGDPDGNLPATNVYETSETGTAQEFIIKLMTQPENPVRVTVTTSNPSEGLVSEQRQAGQLTQLVLEWVPSMWDQPKTVTITGINDDVDDGDVAYSVSFSIASIDPIYGSIQSQTRRLSNADDDTASILVYDIVNLETTEAGGMALFSVNLGSQPVGPVQIGVVSSKLTEGSVFPSILIFNQFNWQTRQFVNITGVDDSFADGNQPYQIFLDPAVSDDMVYSGMVTMSTVSVVNMDDDYAGAKVRPTIGGCYVDNTATPLVHGKRCIFPFISEGVMYTTCAQPVLGGDYWCPTEVNSTDHVVLGSEGKCNDNCTGSLTTTEGVTANTPYFAGIAEFEISLTSSPTSDVTIGLSSEDPTEGLVTPASLIFSAATWNTPQTVTVTAVNDDIADGTQVYTVLTAPCVSNDLIYNAIVNPPDMVVRNLDDDVAGLVWRSDTLETSEDGTSTRIYVKLGSQPQAGVSLTVNVTDKTEGAANPEYLLFTSATWSIERTITITGVDDGLDDADIIYDVILNSLLSTDEEYRNQNEVLIPVRNLAVLDECVDNQQICLAAGQSCRDPNTSPLAKSGWECMCTGSSTGSARATVATCTATGECIANSLTCATAGQACFDVSTRSNDWVCRCIPPSVGADAIGRVAACVLDECLIHASECTAVGQVCNDPNQGSTDLGDWTCNCPEPQVGSAVGKPAVCQWKGECVTRYSTCTEKGQTCNDPDINISGDWECLCLIGQGRSTGTSASCLLDECIVNNAVCTTVSQVCVDPNHSPDSVGDWSCNCQGSDAEGTASAMPATCIIDECKVNRATCLAVGQVCNDPNMAPSSLDDWTCNCVEPATGFALRATATCQWQGGCRTNFATCTSAGQTCRDPTPNQLGSGNTWQCSCVPPHRLTSKVGDAATCILDECDENRHICSKAGQLCLDPNTDPRNTGDWMCQCATPAVGEAVAKPALCAFQGECVEKSSICTTAGQTCYDPNPNVAGDWMCMCVSPQNGSRVGLPATCQHDECNEYWSVCASYGQLCSDPTPVPSKTGDWTCVCPSPAIGAARAKFASCSFSGSCAENSHICTTHGQTCEPDGSTFKCKCIGQSTGEKTGNYSTDCEHDECIEKNDICAAANQICVDRNKKSTSLDDWGCQCSGGANGGFTIGGVATCILDECLANGVVCTEVGQRCIDPDTSAATIGDWYCLCQGSGTGQMVAQRATCVFPQDCQDLYNTQCRAKGQTCVDPEESIPNNAYCQCVWPYSKIDQTSHTSVECELDECILYGTVCSNVGQVCIDTNKATGSTGNWECDCSGGGGTGVGRAVAKPAVCTYTNECEQRATICNRAGQTCFDPLTNVRDNWECRCVSYSPLANPGKKSGGIAENCMIDECLQQRDLCSAVSQICVDPNQLPAARGDWMCKCQGSSRVGEAVAAQAVCILDECIANKQVCNAVGQECQDLVRDPSSLNDWVCNCVGATGQQQGNTATCVEVGECEANAPTCNAAGQSCNDPNPSSNGDWECVCVGDLTGRATGRVATCVLDECILNAATCNAVGQICFDPIQLPTSLNDWECQCLAPATGTSRAQIATCSHVGECIANAVTCSTAGQACRDPDTTRVGDWECVCVGDQEGRQVGRPATCLKDECKQNGKTCTNVGQTCRDPTVTPLGTADWQCDCVGLSSSGSQRGGVATCAWTGECIANNNICSAAGQTCYDPSSAVDGDWMCQCVFPQAGSRKGKPAPCILDECLQDGLICARSGQRCVDPDTNPLALNNWKCECEGSGTGSATAAVADCVYEGECITKASTCTAAGQACRDPDLTTSNDWGCLCITPYLGGEVTNAAVCTFDECLIYGSLCSAAGQTCEDTNKNATSRNDWICKCAGQATNTSVVPFGEVATCTYIGECTNPSNSAVCTTKGQTCIDRNQNKADDWECSCVTPLVGAATGQPATCVLDECVDNGYICVSVGQRCVDPKTFADSLNDWTCECTGSQESGSAVGKAAVCTLDECSIESNRQVCASVGQICIDKNQDPTSRNDWYCTCAGSASGEALMMTAQCEYTGECASGYLTCASSGQYCMDPDQTRAGNWECRCVPPYTGSDIATVAVCEYDECIENRRTCENADQICTDPNKSPLVQGDWYCECADPLVGRGVATAATCSFVGECVSNSGTCTSVGQTCVDPDTSVANNWMCICILPQTGNNATRSAANCQLDECLQKGSVCTSVGQSCIDPDTHPESTDDWTCNCFGAGSGSARGIAAVCTYSEGECQTFASTCSAAGQACNDPNPTTNGDWECQCVPPTQGTGVASASRSCVLDECIENANVCHAEGQECSDPNTSPTSIGDWRCECRGSGTGTALRSPAMCAWTGECQVEKSKCVDVGQTCFDPDTSSASLGNWRCQCVGNQIGEATAQRALCTLDECTIASNKAICDTANQECIDPNTNVTSMGDWLCKCKLPSSGTAIESVATCILDECGYSGSDLSSDGLSTCESCAVNRNKCEQSNQRCQDPDATRTGDWECVCQAPQVGRAVGIVASCEYDECLTKGTICTSQGQLCVDPVKTTASINNWKCVCQGSANDEAVGRKANCNYPASDACQTSASTCTSKGQACRGSSTTAFDCLCIAPQTGTATGAVATCILDECSINSAICTRNGQNCIDPDTSPTSTGDWVCRCTGDASGVARARAAQCVLDECVLNGQICMNAGQKCIDRNTDPSSLGDWACQCAGTSTGSAKASVASCSFTGECSQNAQTCSAVGQACMDPSPAVDDWYCICVEPAKVAAGTPTLPRSQAVCEIDECTVKSDICTNKGQACEDNSLRTNNDWVCKCDGSGSGSKLMAPATCVFATGSLCNQFANVCAAAGQACVSDGSGWSCRCAAPAEGNQVGGVAKCQLDECTSNRQICTAQGQECDDPNTDYTSLGDWRCKCTGDNTVGVAVAKPAKCLLDECRENNITCTSVGQVCHDPNLDPVSTGDWMCSCLGSAQSASNRQVAGQAACAYTGECNVNSRTCTDQGQTCIDPDETRVGDWMCSCVPPMVGKMVGSAATCTLDECITFGSVCTAAGQVCYDKDVSANKLNDWECRCVDGTGTKDRGAATCAWRGECKDNFRTCTAAGQTCVDPNENAPGDWQCECVGTQSGSPSPVSPAFCVQDECKGNSVAALLCSSAGQRCKDPNTSPTSLGDWRCECVPVSSGSAAGTLAECNFVGECVQNSRICTSQGQYCLDSNTNSLNNWECNCLEPAVGRSLREAANCTLDECIANGYKCGNKQQCVDPNRSPLSLDDWKCECTTGTGSARARSATCIVNECEDNGRVCHAVGQTCVDPNPSDDIRGDWMCRCAGSSTGSAIAAVANNCVFTGECAIHASVCNGVGQACVDPDEMKANDWQCMCVNPMGTSATMKPANCVVDECAAGTIGQKTCSAVGQTCTDDAPFANSTGDWRCNCVSPAVGQARGRTADCSWQGECVDNFQTCTSAGQTCDDPNLSTTGDWQCVCVTPATGQKAIAQRATCLIDECQLQTECSKKGQVCKDPRQDVMGDWSCECVGDGQGTQIAAPAVCTYGSTACTNNYATCTSSGQYCVADTTATQGFACACAPPLTGTNKQNAPTVCYQSLVNECEVAANRQVCEAASQQCIDPDTAITNNWRCACTQDNTRFAVGKAYAEDCTVPTGPTTIRMGLTIPGDTAPNEADLTTQLRNILVTGGHTGASVQNMNITTDGRGGQRVVFNIVNTNGASNTGKLGENYRELLLSGLPSRGYAVTEDKVHVGDCAVANSAVKCGNETHVCFDTDGAATGNNFVCLCPSPEHGKANNKVVSTCIQTCDTCNEASTNLTMALNNPVADMRAMQDEFIEALSVAMGVPTSSIQNVTFTELDAGRTNATFTVSAKTNETNAQLEKRVLDNAKADLQGNNALAMNGFVPTSVLSVNPASDNPPVAPDDDDSACFGQTLGVCIVIIGGIVLAVILLLLLLYCLCKGGKDGGKSVPYQQQPEEQAQPEVEMASPPVKEAEPETHMNDPPLYTEPEERTNTAFQTPSREASPEGLNQYQFPSARSRGGVVQPSPEASPSGEVYPFSSAVYPSMGRGRGVAVSPSYVESPLSTRGRGGYVSGTETEAAPGTSGWV